jgi:hypothetical protein
MATAAILKKSTLKATTSQVGQTLPQLPWKQKRGDLKKNLDSFHQTSSNFVGISTVVHGSFWGLKKFGGYSYKVS